jgi:hypothetical protein
MIYEFILEDFMPLKDCGLVHQEGNMLAGESPVTHLAARGGETPLGSAKKAEYEAELQRGDSTLEVAQQTGVTEPLV